MQNEIPAGTKVQVTTTEKGVTTVHDAEVLAHMDGVVHVNIAGDAVSVHPSQIQVTDPPAEGKKNEEPGTPVSSDTSGNDSASAGLAARMAALELQANDIATRVTKLESDFLDLSQRVTAAAAVSAPAAEPIPNDDNSTAPVNSAEPTGEAEVQSAPPAAADAGGA